MLFRERLKARITLPSGLAVVIRHIATAAPFTMGALHGSAGKLHLRKAVLEAATNARRCLIDASAQGPQRHDLNTMDDPESLSLALPDGSKVSALLRVPADARAQYVFAHGAGAGMQHAGMSSLADALAASNVATLRYQFPYMERGSKRVDSPAVAHAAVQAAVAEARRRLPALPLFAGGRSFGGRMTSQAQAISPLDGVRGLAFVAFPLHPAGAPGVERARHLAGVTVPILFLQSTRDKLAELHLLRSVVETLGPRATLHVVDDADHSFHTLSHLLEFAVG